MKLRIVLLVSALALALIPLAAHASPRAAGQPLSAPASAPALSPCRFVQCQPAPDIPPVNAPADPRGPTGLQLTATAAAVTVEWLDVSTSETSFRVSRRAQDGTWQVVHTVATHDRAGDGDEYSWIDTNRSLGLQCYIVAAVGIGSGWSNEDCTVRPDPERFPQNPPDETTEWYGIGYRSGEAAPLWNDATEEYLRYDERRFGINLGWGSAGDNVTAQRRATQSGHRLLSGEPLALRVKDGGWLQYERRDFGINLTWSSTPVYEWYLLEGPPGTDLGDSAMSIWNAKSGDYLVYGTQTFGVNLRWYEDTVPSPPPPSEPARGVETLVVWNCHNEHRGVEMWVLDITAGTPFDDNAYLDDQWLDNGCPYIAEPWTFTPTDGHQYLVRAVDLERPGCSNTPYVVTCTKSELTFTGDRDGDLAQSTIS